eukprot:114097_1
MVNITIYPYGNSRETQLDSGQWNFSCQHGQPECDANMVETCFINLVNFNQNDYMDFVIAFEDALVQTQWNHTDPYATARSVLQTNPTLYKVSWTELSACIGTNGTQGGATGNAYEHQMALWTASTNHQYTPWITLDGRHDNKIENDCRADTLECTCNKYKGTNSCCSQYKKGPIDDVCWREDIKNKRH